MIENKKYFPRNFQLFDIFLQRICIVFQQKKNQIAEKNRGWEIFTFEKSLSGGPQKSIGNIMYENKKISLIIDFVQLFF